MLRQSAVDSARASRFHLSGRELRSQPQDLIYRYLLETLDCDQAPDPAYPRATSGQGTITITGQSMPICDPGAQIRVRSVKCLYLWRCGLK